MTNREAWLSDAVTALSTLFEGIAVTLPPVRVSTGWPVRGGTSTKKRVVGECWKPEVAADGVSQIFISPTVTDSIDVLGILAHELIHAWDRGESKHRGRFAQTARDFGLTAPWTATGVSDELRPALAEIVATIGEYPHSPLNPTLQIKPQTTRMIKIVCPKCTYTLRTTQKWIDVGLPVCCCGADMEVAIK